MKNLKKAAKMAMLAFENGIRLHKDSILLYKNKSFPSAYFFSILTQEEIGKAFLLEEHVYQMRGRVNEIDKDCEKMMLDILISHRAKQGWFSKLADDPHKYHGKKYPRFIKEVTSGKMEEEKQNAIYVGLTKKGNKLNKKGKIIIPSKRITPKDAENQITRVNDFIILLIEECRRGVSMVDTEELYSILKMKVAEELKKLWVIRSKETQRKLNRLIKFRYFK